MNPEARSTSARPSPESRHRAPRDRHSDAVSMGNRPGADGRCAADVLGASSRGHAAHRGTARVRDVARRRNGGASRGLDPLITEAAEHWRIERMNVLDRLILRLAVYEFLYEPDTPGR